MLVNIKDMLGKARSERYCVGAFDASSIEMAMQIVRAAEEKHSPVIVMGLPVDLGAGDMLDYWLHALRSMAEKASVPVCGFLKKCVDCGFTSVMYDASEHPLEENIRLSLEAVKYAHARGVTVEAELGHVGDGIVSGVLKAEKDYDDPESYLTNPDELRRFVAETGVDCLAVAVGTSHGVYVHPPKLDFERLDELNAVSPVPMVMHGGSGTPDDQIRKAVQNGICKLNIYSELLAAYYTKIKEKLDSSGTMAVWVSAANKDALAAIKEVVKEKIELVGSADRA